MNKARNLLSVMCAFNAITGGEYMSLAIGGTCASCADYDCVAGGCFETGKPVDPNDPACDAYHNFMELPDEPQSEGDGA